MDVGRGRSLLGVFKDQVGSQCGWSSGWGRERADRSSHHRLNQVGPHTRCTYEIRKKYAVGGIPFMQFAHWSSLRETPANHCKSRAHTFPPNQSNGALYAAVDIWL